MGTFKNIITRILGILLALLIFSSIIYGIGRFFHFFPPINAIYQKYIIYKIEKESGERSIEYSVALDKLSDIYADENYESWEAEIRYKALKSFNKYKHNETVGYANCLYKYSDYVMLGEKGKCSKFIFECRDKYIKLYKNQLLNDESKRNLIDVINTIRSYSKNTKDEIQYSKLALGILNSIKIKLEEDKRNQVLIYSSLGLAYTDDFSLWIEAQNCFEKAISLSQKEDFVDENTVARITYARLLNQMQDFEKSLEVLNQCDKSVSKNKMFRLTYCKLKYDAFFGKGDLSSAEIENEKMIILNYENNTNVKFLAFINKAKQNINEGNRISMILPIIWTLS